MRLEVVMPSMPTTFRHAHQPTRREGNKAADVRRGSARERGYNSRWDKAAAGHRSNSPLCRYCEVLMEVVEPATLVDHLYPHHGDQGVFWNRTYWISCCKPCHDGFKQKTERKGVFALDDLAARLGLPPLRG